MSDELEKKDKLADILDLYNEPEEISQVPIPAVPSIPQDLTTSDYNEVRTNLKSIIKTNTVAIEKLMEVAEESDSPRAFEVVAKLIDSCVQANEKLLELHRKKKEIETMENMSNPTVTNNAIFIGSTKELLENLKSLRAKTDEQQ
jgi:hypothetical protein